MSYETQGLPEIDADSPLNEILKTAMAMTEQLVEESHRANSEGRVPDEDERREFLMVASQLTGAMIIAKSNVRRWNKHVLSTERKS